MKFPHSRKKVLLFATISLFIFSTCRKDDTPPAEVPLVDLFYKNMRTLSLDVAYEPGAEPFLETISGAETWRFTERNIEILFSERPVELDVFVPYQLADMTLIPNQNKNDFTANDIRNIATRHQKITGTEEDGALFVVFLNGSFRQQNTTSENVIGVHLNNSNIIAIFKPLVMASGVSRTVREFVEQSVVIHEIGHAIGLVENGIPLTSSHHDEDNPAHCTNQDCVMFWQNEISFTMTSFVQNFRDGVETLIFGQECVDDVRNYFP